jgi:GTP-binding protein SAR1
MRSNIQARRIWREYYAAVDAVVFLIDAAAPERFPESKIELNVCIRRCTQAFA